MSSFPQASHMLKFADAAQYSEQQHGLYMMAFSMSVDAILDTYMQKLGNVEEDLLKDPHLGVPHLVCELSEVSHNA